jgi:hypothetical protein
MLVTGKSEKGLIPRTAKVYNVLTCPKKAFLFTVKKGAEEQCHRRAPTLSNQCIKVWKYNNNNKNGYEAFKFFFSSIV